MGPSGGFWAAPGKGFLARGPPLRSSPQISQAHGPAADGLVAAQALGHGPLVGPGAGVDGVAAYEVDTHPDGGIVVSGQFRGVALFGVGGGLYIGAGLGPGPRDGLMTGLTRRTGHSIASVRTALELGTLVVGWLLGGSVGVGTVLFAFGIGPVLQAALGRLTIPAPSPAE